MRSFQICKECLVYLDNQDLHINGHKEVLKKVNSIVKDLVTKNKIKNRIEKYSKNYDKEIRWMRENYGIVSQSKFLSDMFDRLIGGKKIYSKKMHSYVKSSIEKLNNKKQVELQDDVYNNIKIKIEKILYLISNFYNIKINNYFEVEPDSASTDSYNFVLSVYKYFIKNKNCSTEQLFYMNVLYKRYIKYMTMIKNNTQINSDLPF